MTMVYSIVSLIAVIGLVSFAVDYGRVRLIKAELQTAADATAIGAMNAYRDAGYSYDAAATAGYSMLYLNPVDKNSGVNPTLTYAGGSWNAGTRTFSTSYYAGTPAVRLTLSRTAANGNAVPLYFGRLIGMNTADFSATAIATMIDTQSAPVNLPSIANPYLAGQPSGSSTNWGDNTSNATPYGVTAIPVTPGTWITVTGATGTTSIVPGTTPYVGPEGDPTRWLHHGENWDHTNFNIGPEDGIADSVMPASALYGLFLTDQAPDLTAAPATIDWSQPGVADQPLYKNILPKQPFLIGDGTTSGGVVQRFLVPPGATRLYLGVWDGVTQSNNGGALTATINLRYRVQLVK